MKKVDIDNLSDAVYAELMKYDADVTESLKKEAKEVAKDCTSDIQQSASKLFGGKGKYARGWTMKIAYEGRSDIRIVVYNKSEPQLAHLLEKGHALVNGGRFNGKPHIKPAEEAAERELLGKIKVVVKG